MSPKEIPRRVSTDEERKKAFAWLLRTTKIKSATLLGNILGRGPTFGQRRAKGRKPMPEGVALLYLASGMHPYFCPSTDKEVEAVKLAITNPSQELQNFQRQYGERVKKARKRLEADRNKNRSRNVHKDVPAPEPLPRTLKPLGFLESQQRIIELLEMFLEKKGQENSKIVTSPLADAIVAGTAEFANQVLGVNRFSLNRESFRRIKTVTTDAEIEDTVRLAAELARRLRIISQMGDEHRIKVLYELGASLNQLRALIESYKEVNFNSLLRTLGESLANSDDTKKE